MKGAFEANPTPVLGACPLCDAPGGALVARGEHEWVRCSCGAVYKRATFGAAPAPHGPGEAAGDAASPGAARYDAAYFDRYRRRRRRRVAKSRRQILDVLEIAGPGTLVDVGCSLGYTLEAATSLGLDAVGVDVSEQAVAECRRLGYAARVGALDALPLEDASVRIVVMKHVLEHTPQPRRALAEVRRVLESGGALFLAVPHGDYFKARLWPRSARFYRGEGGAAHFVYYTPATLRTLVEDSGFRVASVGPVLVHRRHGGTLRAVLETAVAPVRGCARAVAATFGLAKEFWLSAEKR